VIIEKEVVKREAIFTGKRRPKERRLCACGCGEWFTTTFEEKIYKNKTHAKRAERQNVATRVTTNGGE